MTLIPNLLWLTLVHQLTTIWLMPISAEGCPPTDAILPCRCSVRGKEIQIWCSHSNLPQIMDGIKSVERNIKGQIDELVLENNQLPALPGRFFGNLQIVRLMLRYNSIERVSNGWLNELENSLVEIYIVEPQLRSIPIESLNGMINIIAITIHSDELKHLPDFSGLLSLNYLSVQSAALTELQPQTFRHLPKLQDIHISGGRHLNRLEAGLFDGLISLKNIDLSRNAISWIHIRAFARLPNLVSLKLSHNHINDVGMIGRIVKDLEHLKRLRLDHNFINVIEDGSFVDLPHLAEIHLNDNRITEIEYGAFLRTPMLKTIYLHNNHIKRIHPESFLQASGSGVEIIYIYNNEIAHIDALRSLLDALPTLRFLDMSDNFLTDIPYGSLRGHGTLEQLHLNNNRLRMIDRDALMAMPALRELRMRNNSLSLELPLPFWNLPGLKGLDLSLNLFHNVDARLLAGLPSLRRIDLSGNSLTVLDPATFIHNAMLETLNISTNELVKVHAATLRNLDHLFEVDASFNHFEEFMPGLPQIVERVSMRGNHISNLPGSGSKSLNLPNLRMLDLSYNLIEQLPKYSFDGVPQLRVLSLANNNLRSLDDTAFIGAQRLELLHLQENQLTVIDERTFLPLFELRNLNLQGNKLEAITDNLFSNNSRLEQLDLSRNIIRTISPAAFEAQRSLEYLDLSSNSLADISIGLGNLHNMHDIDLSFNQISRIQADVVSTWRNVMEIRLANNLVAELKHGTFRNLPKLQYLDLSSNEISNIEPGAIKQLPDLQELVLADNKLMDIKDHVFETLPNLLASHFQYNKLRYISPESFYNSPSIVFLNLSNNHFRNMENIGLRSMRNLEVLDLSANGVKLIPTMPLKALNWLVELKLDNNRICKIQGDPFETMPRLRVLSMRNNQLRTIRERTFRNLRGNIAILDVDGNPIDCSCEMQWLSVWLQETNFPLPGPRCKDGRLLRATRIDRSLCSSTFSGTNERTGSVGHSDSSTGYVAGLNGDHLPLLNDHGDIFQRDLPEDFNDECYLNEPSDVQAEKPLPGESEYFYDQYVDYTPSGNETTLTPTSEATNNVLSHNLRPQRPTISSNIDLNNTVLKTSYFTKRRPPAASSSQFTFFGYPIPSLSIGRFFGFGDRGRKERGEKSTDASTNTQMPVTHRMGQITSVPSASHGKIRMYQTNSAEFEKYLQPGKEQQERPPVDGTARNRIADISASEETFSNEAVTRGIFRTAFREPSSIERGGFRPIVPEHVGGFMPVHNPQTRSSLVDAIIKNNVTITTTEISKNTSAQRQTNPQKYINFIPIVMEEPNQTKLPQKPPHPTSSNEEFEVQTYYVTELNPEITTMPLAPLITTETSTTANTTTSPKITTTITSTTDTPLTTNNSHDNYDKDLKAQSLDLLKPPLFGQTTTSETILLIPPPEEHIALIKSHTWVTTTTTTEMLSAEEFTYTTSPPPTRPTKAQIPPPSLRPPGGRSTITKVYTPHGSHQYLPTAEEYQRTTPSGHTGSDYLHMVNAQKRTELDISAVERIDRKDGMDWYYESFKKKREFNDPHLHVPKMSSKKIDKYPLKSNTANSNGLTRIFLIVTVTFGHWIRY